MTYSKLGLGLFGILAVSVSLSVFAADTDTDNSTNSTTTTTTTDNSSYGRWSDTDTDRPGSLIPYASYGYLGFGLGQSKYDLGGECTPGFRCDDRSFAFKVYTGGNFSRLIGMEIGYWNLGRARANGADTTAQGANIDLLLNLPIGDRFNVFAKGGGVYAWTKTGSDVPLEATGEKDDFGWTYGAGVQLELTQVLAIRADWDQYRLQFAPGDHQDNLYTGGLVFKF